MPRRRRGCSSPISPPRRPAADWVCPSSRRRWRIRVGASGSSPSRDGVPKSSWICPPGRASRRRDGRQGRPGAGAHLGYNWPSRKASAGIFRCVAVASGRAPWSETPRSSGASSMCGICGIVALEPQTRLPSAEVIRAMTDRLRHRGPDDEGFHLDAGAALGHRRLSIIDLAGGHQPIANEDHTRFIVFNGEIYNHREIRAYLEKKGHRYRTASDTETILHLVEEEGIEGLNRMNGMWGFAVWDAPRRRLLLARDRLGIKPLYYSQIGHLLLFASEIKSLVASGLLPTDLDPAALASYLDLLYVPSPRTIFSGIRKLPPGHALVADAGGVRVERYWRPTFTLDRVPVFEEAAERVKDLLTDAVKVRLLSEVPLGAFLSGGIDSSLVVGLMSRVMDRPVQTFTVGFQGEGWYDESGEAEAVARHFGTDHHALQVTSLDLPATLEETVPALDEPMCDPASIPTYLLSRYARRWVTVALTGEGADELFGGY